MVLPPVSPSCRRFARRCSLGPSRRPRQFDRSPDERLPYSGGCRDCGPTALAATTTTAAFATLSDVIDHYDRFFGLRLSALEKTDLIEYLKSLRVAADDRRPGAGDGAFQLCHTRAAVELLMTSHKLPMCRVAHTRRVLWSFEAQPLVWSGNMCLGGSGRSSGGARVNGPHTSLQNHLLAALPVAESERLESALELTPMPLGEVLYESGTELRHVYFPTTYLCLCDGG